MQKCKKEVLASSRSPAKTLPGIFYHSDSASNCASSRYNFLSSVQNCLLVKRGYLTFEDCCGNTSRPQKAYSSENMVPATPSD
uniref:SREBP regulating gene protein n=1 Tax=Heterorhabditis bacteriophora TaxID=37862 RepID=A0A1I7X9D0_HETBA